MRYFVAAGRFASAALPPLLPLAGYSLVLGLEFVLLRRIDAGSETPRANWREMFRAWAGEVAYSLRIFCWQQPFRSTAEPDLLPAQAGGNRGVVLVHGFFCNRGLWNDWMSELRRRGVPFIAVNLEPVFGAVEVHRGRLDEAIRRLDHATGRKPVIVAHSMGGLVVRDWLAACSARGRVQRIITVGAPHHGTWLARFSRSRSGRQMRLGSAWLRELAASEDLVSRSLFTCFYGNCDNVVFPVSAARLSGARNRLLRGVAHVRMTAHPSVFAETLNAIASSDAGSDAGPHTAELATRAQA